MPHPVVHFAVHADDVPRAKAFYEAVFGWEFEAWGPPDFYLIHTGGEGAIRGALQARHEPLSGAGLRGFECTVAIDDVAATRSAVEAAGGTILLAEATIPTVGTLVKFADTEGNVLCAMRYEAGVMG